MRVESWDIYLRKYIVIIVIVVVDIRIICLLFLNIGLMMGTRGPNPESAMFFIYTLLNKNNPCLPTLHSFSLIFIYLKITFLNLNLQK